MDEGASRPGALPGPADQLPAQVGAFELRAILGQGGSGTVYDAAWGHRRIALKVLRAELWPTDRERERFFSEAALLSSVDHAGVVKVLGSGALPDGRPYLAMERVEGESLAARVARGPVPLPEALALFEQLCHAVAALHQRGLIHRDIKPENVILAGAYPVLLDFGIAKSESAPASTVTQEGTLRGTPAYMAPERFFGAPATVATDVYELAVLFYAMVTARLPWDSSADPTARLNPPRPTELGHPLPPELETMLLGALSTRAEARPGSALALAGAMRAAAGAAGSGPAPRYTEDLHPSAVAGPGQMAGSVARTSTGDRRAAGGGPGGTTGDRAAAGGGPGGTTGDRAAAPAAGTTPRARRRLLVAAASVLLGAGLIATVVLAARRGGVPAAADAGPGPGAAATLALTHPVSTDAAQAPGALAAPPPLWPRSAAPSQVLDRALGLHPRDTLLLMAVSVPAWRKSPLIVDALASQKDGQAGRYLAMLDAMCGFDVLASLDDVSIGVSQATAVQADFVVHGRFSRAPVEKCLAFILAKDGQEDRAVSRRGAVTRLAGASHTLWIGWPDAHTFVISTRPGADQAWMKARLARRDPVRDKAEMVHLLDAIDPGAALWMVAVGSASASSPLPGVPPPRSAYASVRLTSEIEIYAGLRYRGPEPAAQAATSLQKQLDGFKSDPVAAIWLKDAHFSVRDNDAIFTVKMGSTMAAITLKSLLEMGGKLGGT